MFKEDIKNVLAKTNSVIYQKIKDNIYSNNGWFANTHGNDSVVQYFIPINGKNTPYAQQVGCDGYSNSNLQIFNSCNNAMGSHTNIFLNWTFLPNNTYTELAINYIGLR